jgi:hypothetical protein
MIILRNLSAAMKISSMTKYGKTRGLHSLVIDTEIETGFELTKLMSTTVFIERKLQTNFKNSLTGT